MEPGSKGLERNAHLLRMELPLSPDQLSDMAAELVRRNGEEMAMVTIEDMNEQAIENPFFRRVVTTGEHCQVVLMSIPPGGEIGDEIHAHVDQVLVFVTGAGEAVLEGERTPIGPGRLVFVPAGTRHNFVNTGDGDLKLYTVYAPPEHAPGTVHKTKAEADAAEG